MEADMRGFLAVVFVLVFCVTAGAQATVPTDQSERDSFTYESGGTLTFQNSRSFGGADTCTWTVQTTYVNLKATSPGYKSRWVILIKFLSAENIQDYDCSPEFQQKLVTLSALGTSDGKSVISIPEFGILTTTPSDKPIREFFRDGALSAAKSGRASFGNSRVYLTVRRVGHGLYEFFVENPEK